MAQRGVIGTTALVLAGGPADELSAVTPGAPNKAFITIGGMTLLERTLRALRASASISRIVVVAPPHTHDRAEFALADECRRDGVLIRDSLRSGLHGLPPNAQILVSASDLPVLTAQSVDDYVMRAYETGADVTYGCVERKIHLAKYPQVPHTWAPLRDGTFCGTGFVTLRPRIWPSLERFIERLGQARKNPAAPGAAFRLGHSTSVRDQAADDSPS